MLADATQVEQALLNLCTNAILALGHQKGSVTIELSTTVLALPFNDRIGVPPGRYVTLRVRDTGIGIATDKLAHIFSGFSQAESNTTRRFGGTGLGLSISYQIVEEKHRGRLKCVSEVSKGTEFLIELPVRQKVLAAQLECL